MTLPSFSTFINEAPDRMGDSDSNDFRRDYRNNLDTLNRDNYADQIQRSTDWVSGNWYYCANPPHAPQLGLYLPDDNLLVHISYGAIDYAARIIFIQKRSSFYQIVAGRTRRKMIDAREVLKGLTNFGRSYLHATYLESSDVLSGGGIEMWKKFLTIAHSDGAEVGIAKYYGEKTPYNVENGPMLDHFARNNVWNNGAVAPYIKIR